MLLWQIKDYITTFLLIIRAKFKNWRLSDRLQFKKFDYGDHERQYLLWYDSQSENRTKNIIFFIHGGGWNKGSPEFFKFIADFFTKLGFITVMPSYRLAPDYQYPDQEIDVFKALNKTQKIIDDLNLRKNIIIVGQSAGAQLGALVLLNQKLQKEYKINNDFLNGFLSISGPLDLSRPCRTIRAEKYLYGFVPTAQKRKKANPSNYIYSDFNTPVFCLHGAKDPLVPKDHSIDFIEKVEIETKADTKLDIYENKHHSDLADLFFEEGSANSAVKEWLLKVDNSN